MRVNVNTITNWEINRTKIERLYYPIIQEYLGYLPKEYEMSELSYKLIRYRWEQDISIKQLAKQVGVYYDCIMNAEMGKLNFQKRTLKKIQAFKVV